MSVLVFIEQRNGQVRPVSREVLGEATRLAEKLGGPVVGVCVAASDPGLSALGEAGAARVLLATHEAFAQYDAAGYTRAVVAAVEAVTRIVEKTPDASRPVPGQGLRLKWPPQGVDLEADALEVVQPAAQAAVAGPAVGAVAGR